MKSSVYCAARPVRAAAIPVFVLAALVAALLACASAPISALAAEGDGAASDLAAASLNVDAKAAQKASTVKAQNYSELYAPYPAKYSSLRLGAVSQVDLNSGNDYVQWFSFTPSQSGFYKFEASNSDGDSYGALYAASNYAGELKRIAYDDDSGSSGWCFKIVAFLDSGATYYLACSEISDYSDSTYELTVTSYDDHNLANAKWDSKTKFWSGSTIKFEDLEAVLRIGEYYYDDEEETWDYTNHYLEANSDYRFSGWYSEDGTALNAAPKEAGNYYARVIGIGSYTGECKLEFSIYDPYDLGNGMWYLRCKSAYADTAINERSLELAVVPDDESGKPPVSAMPTLGKHFKVKAWYKGVDDIYDTTYQKISSAPTAPGYYKVEVEGISPYKGTLEAYFRVFNPKSIKDYVVDSYSSLFVGTTPSLSNLGVVVYRYSNASVLLKPGVDYALARWEKNVYDEEDDAYKRVPTTTFTEPGTYFGVLVGKGAYQGEQSFSFSMHDPYDMNLYDLECTRYVAYDGKPVSLAKLNPKVFYEDQPGHTKTLTYGTDYTLEYCLYEDVYDEDGEWIDSRRIDLDPSKIIDPGWYYVNAVGKGKYHGGQSSGFRIVDSRELDYATVSGITSPCYLANGKTLTLKPTVTALGGTKLIEGKHYKAVWSRYDDATEELKPASSTIGQLGDYHVEFRAIENSGYVGSFEMDFTVRSDSERESLVGEYFIDGIPASYTYTGKPFMPTPTVRSLDWYHNTLKPNVDYIVTYRQNVNAGTAQVAVIGAGSYSGTLTKSFTINKANNPMIAQPIKRTVNIPSKLLKKKAAQVKNILVRNAKGKVAFKNVSANKVAKKFKINNKGVLMIPAKCPVGAYTVKIKVTDNGGTNYKSATKSVAFKVKVKK